MIGWRFWFLLLFVFFFGYAYSLVAGEQMFYDMRFLDGVSYGNVYSEQLYLPSKVSSSVKEWLSPLRFECLEDFYLLETVLEEEEMNSSHGLLFSDEFMVVLPHRLKGEVSGHYVDFLRDLEKGV